MVRTGKFKPLTSGSSYEEDLGRLNLALLATVCLCWWWACDMVKKTYNYLCCCLYCLKSRDWRDPVADPDWFSENSLCQCQHSFQPHLDAVRVPAHFACFVCVSACPDYCSPSRKIVCWTAYTVYFEITVTSHQLDYEFKSTPVNSKLWDSLLVVLLIDITA